MISDAQRFSGVRLPLVERYEPQSIELRDGQMQCVTRSKAKLVSVSQPGGLMKMLASNRLNNQRVSNRRAEFAKRAKFGVRRNTP